MILAKFFTAKNDTTSTDIAVDARSVTERSTKLKVPAVISVYYS